VVIFNEDTPYNLIKRIKPDVLVKGGDYKNKEIVGSDIAKETKLIEFVEQKSTTNIIERIKNA
jgi:D-beta-D-heptose 7-phosphate kinase/D-beta-D-heptose 1-phosphate adenosyltransferase